MDYKELFKNQMSLEYQQLEDAVRQNFGNCIDSLMSTVISAIVLTYKFIIKKLRKMKYIKKDRTVFDIEKIHCGDEVLY